MTGVQTCALPICIYARAAAWILGADRFDARMWQSLEKQAGVESNAAEPEPEPHASTEPQAGRVTTPRRRGWRVSTPKYME